MAKKAASQDMDLITAVVRTSLAEGVLQAAMKAGAPGITYFPALGTGVKEGMGYAGSLIEHEKKALWIVVEKRDTQKVLEAIVDAANLSLPGEGFAYVQTVSYAVGFVGPAGGRV